MKKTKDSVKVQGMFRVNITENGKVVGDAAFTGAGTLVMPTVNDTVTWEQQYVFWGEDSFPPIPIAFSGASTNTFKPNYLMQLRLMC